MNEGGTFRITLKKVSENAREEPKVSLSISNRGTPAAHQKTNPTQNQDRERIKTPK